MPDLQIRAMTPADTEPVLALYRTGHWVERRPFLERVLAMPVCQPIVGTLDGAVVGTGLATVNGSVGWVGSIFVHPDYRHRTFGRALTDAVCERLEAAGCRTLALIASEYGRPLYLKMGFRIDAVHQVFEAAPSATSLALLPGKTLRRMRPDDIDRVGALDRRATGEDRRGLLGGLVDEGWLLEAGDSPGGELLGFLISIMPESGTIVAPDPEDAACLLDLLRNRAAGRTKVARAVVVGTHTAGMQLLAERGWAQTFSTPRMLRGPGIDWDPTLIWSVLGFAFG
jgi:GNAT superfamily N-acetyltransferase